MPNNADYLSKAQDLLINYLCECNAALKTRDAESLRRYLKEGGR